MKKTKKTVAFLTAVIMIAFCFGTFAFAEDAGYITLVDAQMTGDNEYLLEFSAPVRILVKENVLRMQSPIVDTDGQTVSKIEYLTEGATTAAVGGFEYSTKIKLTFDALAESFNKGSYGISIAENGHESSFEHLGAISPETMVGANGEPVKSTYTSVEAMPKDVVWIPTLAADYSFAYGVHVKNTYEEPIRVLAAELTECTADAATFKVYFSAPVRITTVGKNSPVKFYWNPFSAAQSWGVESVTYVDALTYTNYVKNLTPGEIWLGSTTNEQWSDTLTFTYNITGTNANSWLKGRLKLGDGGLMFVDNKTAASKAENEGFISPYTVAGINGRQVLANITHTDGTEGVWLPFVTDADSSKSTVHVSASTTENAHAVAGAPYAVSAAHHAGINTISVEFSEPVNIAEGAATLRPAVTSETSVVLTAVSDGNTVKFTYEGELPAEFAEGYGIAFADGAIVDADGIPAAPNYVSETAKLGWIPTDDGTYPVTLDVHTDSKTNCDETNHWTECECGLADENSSKSHTFIKKKSTAYYWTECECGTKTAEKLSPVIIIAIAAVIALAAVIVFVIIKKKKK